MSSQQNNNRLLTFFGYKNDKLQTDAKNKQALQVATEQAKTEPNQAKKFTITIENSKNDITNILTNNTPLPSNVKITKINGIPVTNLQPNVDLIKTIFPDPKPRVFSNLFTKRKNGGKKRIKTRKVRN